jgi:uncharacterized protein YdiU (UPF0061 family)
MEALRFDNRFSAELPGDPDPSPRRRQVIGAVWSNTTPTPVPAPRLIAHSREVAELLEIPDAFIASQDFAEVFGGNALLPGMRPISTAYGGHQFGSWAGQLGDGRAISLGEVVNSKHERWELQLKGAGPTPYSRTADGRAVLRSSIREFLCSEAMHHLGVPTTRALSLVATGEQIVRDVLYNGNPEYEPGAIVCRVAPSFTRFGHFELPSARGDVELLEKLLDFTIARDYPQIARNVPDKLEQRAAFFEEVCARTAFMMAHWMRVGFVHGVMNTDNMSILGLTIDYGPYGWLENFDPGWTPNTTDAGGRRYRFGSQPQVAHWNLGQLARAISRVFPTTDPLQAGMERYADVYAEASRMMTAQKLGLATLNDEDAGWVTTLFELMSDAEIDMTLFFRLLADVDLGAIGAASIEALRPSFYVDPLPAEHETRLIDWLNAYGARTAQDALDPSQRRTVMNAANPRYVLRNYLAQEAIDLATQGDPSRIHLLLDVLRRPYDDQPEHAVFAQKRPEWARHRVGCSMLSCSS